MEYNKQYRYLEFLENIYKTYSNTKREVTVELTDCLIDIKKNATEEEQEFVLNSIMDLTINPQYHNLINATVEIFYNNNEKEEEISNSNIKENSQDNDVQNVDVLTIIEEIYSKYKEGNYKINDDLRKYLHEQNTILQQEEKEEIVKYVMDLMLPDSPYSNLINELPSIFHDSDEQEVYYSESDDIDESLYSSLSGSSDDFDEYSSDKSRSSSLSYSE